MIKVAGLTITKLKDTSNVIFSLITDGRVEVRMEVNHLSKVEGIPVKYELVDGSYTEILSLSPNQLILEKISAYKNRKFVRDIYDIYHLSGVTDDLTPIRTELSSFLHKIERPVDEEVLRALVFVGNPPTFDRMVAELRRISK